MHAPVSYLRQTKSWHSPSYFSEGEICLKICNLNEMKSRQERNLHHFQNQIKLQFSSINCQFKITLLLEQCFVRVNEPQRTHSFSVWRVELVGSSQLDVVAVYRTKALRGITVGLLVRRGTSQTIVLLLWPLHRCQLWDSRRSPTAIWLYSFHLLAIWQRHRRQVHFLGWCFGYGVSHEGRAGTPWTNVATLPPCTWAGAFLVSDSRLLQYGVAVTLAGHYYSWTTWSLVSEQVTADRLPDNSTVGYNGLSPRLATPLVTPFSSTSHYRLTSAELISSDQWCFRTFRPARGRDLS